MFRYRREVTTLGRGGSDTTAVALAAALDAEWCEICSDVDGVYTADPRIVPDARRLGVVSYEETQEMAEAGAKVLSATAVEFAKERGIAIYARATGGPLPGEDPASDGTVVRKHPPRAPGSVVGVASEKNVLALQSTGLGEELLAFLDAEEVCGKQLHATALSGHVEGLTLILSRENLPDEDRLRQELSACFAGSVRLLDQLGAVSVIGAGINTSYRNVRTGSEVLRPLGIRAVSTSSFRITWLLPDAVIDEAVRALHSVFLTA